MQELFTRAPDGRATEAREVRAEERQAERNACFFKNIKMRILDVKEKKTNGVLSNLRDYSYYAGVLCI